MFLPRFIYPEAFVLCSTWALFLFCFFSAYRYIFRRCAFGMFVPHIRHYTVCICMFVPHIRHYTGACIWYVGIIPHYTSVRLYHTYYRFYSADVYMVCLYLIHMGIIPHSICVLHFVFPQVGRGPSLCPCDFNSASFVILDLVFFR